MYWRVFTGVWTIGGGGDGVRQAGTGAAETGIGTGVHEAWGRGRDRDREKCSLNLLNRIQYIDKGFHPCG